jgi:hypothetical protein
MGVTKISNADMVKYFKNLAGSEKEEMKTIYSNTEKYFKTYIESELKLISKQYITNDNNSTNITSIFKVDSSFHVGKNGSITYSTGIFQEIYFYPIPLSFTYPTEDGKGLLYKPNSNFFLLYIDEQSERTENVKTFYFVVLYEILIYFVYIICVNFFIWVLFSLVFYYFLKGFLMPIKIINKLLKHIFFFQSLNKNEDMASTMDQSSQNLDQRIFYFINSIFKLESYEEINECMLTLTKLHGIRKFRSSNFFDLNLNFKLSQEKLIIENMIDAMYFLMYSIPDDIIKNIKSDAEMITRLIEINFIYKLNNSTSKQEVNAFYDDINDIVDIVSNINVESRVIKRGSLGDLKDFSNEELNEQKKSLVMHFKKLKEEVHYRYCIYKMKSIELDDEKKKNDIEDYKNSEEPVETINNDKEKPLRQKIQQEDIMGLEREKTFDQKQSLAEKFDEYLTYVENEKSNNQFDEYKCIAAHIIQAGLLFDILKESDGIKQCIKALDKIKSLKETVINQTGKITKLAFVCVSNLFFEKILFLMSSLSEKSNQKKTQFFIYLNMLDLGPVYDKEIRNNITNKLTEEIYTKYRKVSDEDMFEKLKNAKLVKHKIEAIGDMSFHSKKSIVFLLDYDFPLLKDSDFQEILLSNAKSNEAFTYYSVYYDKCYIFRDKKIVLEYRNPKKKDFFEEHRESDLDIVNLYDKISDNMIHYIEDYNNPDHIVEFINNFDPIEHSKKNKMNLDSAIIQTLKHHVFHEDTRNNFLFVFTTIDSRFIFEKQNLVKLSGCLFQCRYSLIICMMYDDKILQEEKYNLKFKNYLSFIERDIVNGHLFLVKSFSMIKFILNLCCPTEMKQFDPERLISILNLIDVKKTLNG